MPQRVRDIRPDYAEGLRRVHQLAAEGTRLHRALDAVGLVTADRLDLSQQSTAVDRERALLEIDLRGNGVPAVWLDVARRLGSSQRPWSPDQILPPVRTDSGRRSSSRVAADTHLVVDMAAVSVVREHLLSHHRSPADTDSAPALQFRRNMGVVWQRSVITAHTINLNQTERTQVTDAATAELTRRISLYRAMSLDDIQTLWDAYTGGAIADTYRKSITANTPSGHQLGASLPAPQHWLDQARASLAGRRLPEPNRDIDQAIAAAISGPIREDDPGRDRSYGVVEVAGADVVIEGGRDP
ncbi:hypothetical protein ACFVH4_15705 [Nocardia ignorata]|uniref:hypothetical protein n=1 Tax=Nocardia ignorata TaxID=145285 RepID=UPI00364236C7